MDIVLSLMSIRRLVLRMSRLSLDELLLINTPMFKHARRHKILRVHQWHMMDDPSIVVDNERTSSFKA